MNAHSSTGVEVECVSLSLCVSARTCACMYICLCICQFVRVCVYVRACVCVCVKAFTSSCFCDSDDASLALR